MRLVSCTVNPLLSLPRHSHGKAVQTVLLTWPDGFQEAELGFQTTDTSHRKNPWSSEVNRKRALQNESAT